MPHSRSMMAIVLVAMLAVAGCSTVVAGQAAPAAGALPNAGARPDTGSDSEAPPSDAGVAWADAACGEFLQALRVLRDQPKADLANPAGTVDAYKQYFGRSVPALDAALTQLSALGPGPLDGGQQLLDGMVGLVTVMRDAHRSAQVAVDAIDPASPTVMSQELPAALALTEVQQAAPQVDVGATRALNAAARMAPNCQAITG
jgi:hypothetical protein